MGEGFEQLRNEENDDNLIKDNEIDEVDNENDDESND